jgi:hypothetical protein
MWRASQTSPGRLLRVLFVWLCAVPAHPSERRLLFVGFRISQGREQGHKGSRGQKSEAKTSPASQTLDAMAILDHCARHARPKTHFKSHLRHYLPGDYSLAANAGCGRLFSCSRVWTRPASRAAACKRISRKDGIRFSDKDMRKQMTLGCIPILVGLYPRGATMARRWN